MAFKLKTSKRASEIFDQIESSENLPCYTLVKLAMALSLRSKKPLEESDFRTNTLGRELNRQTITGDADAVYKCLMELYVGKHLTDEEFLVFEPILDYYKKLGYSVIFNTELDKIKELLKDKTSVFTGQTGAGKSTLLNKLKPDWNLETGEISMPLGRGKHTTRVVTLYELYGGKVMDTPGFSALDFHNYSKEDIKNAFIEFPNFPCPFKDCMHTKEEECEVKRAVRENNILESRYLNYLDFIQEEKV